MLLIGWLQGVTVRQNAHMCGITRAMKMFIDYSIAQCFTYQLRWQHFNTLLAFGSTQTIFSVQRMWWKQKVTTCNRNTLDVAEIKNAYIFQHSNALNAHKSKEFQCAQQLRRSSVCKSWSFYVTIVYYARFVHSSPSHKMVKRPHRYTPSECGKSLLSLVVKKCIECATHAAYMNGCDEIGVNSIAPSFDTALVA